MRVILKKKKSHLQLLQTLFVKLQCRHCTYVGLHSSSVRDSLWMVEFCNHYFLFVVKSPAALTVGKTPVEAELGTCGFSNHFCGA